MMDAEINASDIYLQKNIVFNSGEFYLIKANSGNGKSSLLNFIYGVNSNYSGKITFSTNDQSSFKIDKLSYVFQDFKLFEALSVIENIQIKNKLTNFKTDLQIETLLQKVGLLHKKNALVKTLSLGQRQRVSIIRALCMPFEFLLLDEPFSHLDNDNIKILTTIIEKQCKAQNAGIILTTLNNDYLFNYDSILNL
ncbi:MAG: ATP-binding cassette domain-containing protein [Flavobacteriaceae bacterium]